MKTTSLLESYIKEIPKEVKKFVRRQGEIATQIADILKKNGIKQKEFAKTMNMKESQLSRILSGEVNLTIKTITKIEVALGEDIINVPLFVTDVVATESEFIKNIQIDHNDLKFYSGSMQFSNTICGGFLTDESKTVIAQ
jgi:transcriptional regulator with XRE-family HTH domain